MAKGLASSDHGRQLCMRSRSLGISCGFWPVFVPLMAGLSGSVLAALVHHRGRPVLPRESVGLVELMTPANMSIAYYAAYIVSAERPSMCLHLYFKPADGAKLRLWDCPVNKDQLTKFLLPVSGQGEIRLLSDLRFCLDAPGNDGLLQLWTCAKLAKKGSNMKFEVRAEAPAWFKYPHYDLPNGADMEHMEASDLHAVMRRAREKGFAGFSVYHNKAYLKKGKDMETTELLYMGVGDPCTFYQFRPRGDVTFRLARKRSQCMHISSQLRQPILGMAPCDDSNADGSQALARRFGIRHIGLDEERRKHVQNFLKPLHLNFVGETVRHHHTDSSTTTFSTTLTGTSTVTDTTSSLVSNTTTRSIANTVRNNGSVAARGDTSDRPVSATPHVQHSTLVRNVDYGLLRAKHPLYTHFGQTVSDCVADAAGVSSDSVTWKLKAGSVLVVSSISAPEGIRPSVLHSRLEESAKTLSHHIAGRLHSLEGIEDVTTGNLSVSDVRPLGPAILPGPPVRLDVLSAALILLVAAAVWLWCRVCHWQQQEERATKGSEQQTEPLLTELGKLQSPRPGVSDRALIAANSGMPLSTTDVSGQEPSAVGPCSASTASREALEQEHAEDADHDNPFDYESGADQSDQDEEESPGNPFDAQGRDSSPERGNPFSQSRDSSPERRNPFSDNESLEATRPTHDQEPRRRGR